MKLKLSALLRALAELLGLASKVAEDVGYKKDAEPPKDV